MTAEDHQAWLARQRALIAEAELNPVGVETYHARIQRTGRWWYRITICIKPPPIELSDGRLLRPIEMEEVPSRSALGRRRAERKAGRLVRRRYRRAAIRGES